jgi:hypothetical protein
LNWFRAHLSDDEYNESDEDKKMEGGRAVKEGLDLEGTNEAVGFLFSVWWKLQEASRF